MKLTADQYCYVYFCMFEEPAMFKPVNSISDNWNDNLQSLNQERNEALVPVFNADWTSVPSLKRQVYAVWTPVSFPLCQRSCLIWRIMTKH